MSQSAMQEITCPKCGKKTSFLVWDSINTMENPEMKEKVRNDEAFRFHCPECGASALLNYNFLYHQQEDKVLIYVSADGGDTSYMAQIRKTCVAHQYFFRHRMGGSSMFHSFVLW